jgi:hypothetical protein
MRQRQPPLASLLGRFPPIDISGDGRVTKATVAAINDGFSRIISKINGAISLGDGVNGSWMGNVDGNWLEILTPSVADTEFIVLHDLGRVPTGWLGPVRKDKFVDIHDSRPGSWTESVMYLKASVGSATILIGVF